MERSTKFRENPGIYNIRKSEFRQRNARRFLANDGPVLLRDGGKPRFTGPARRRYINIL
jgi:hypothetical protein